MVDEVAGNKTGQQDPVHCGSLSVLRSLGEVLAPYFDGPRACLNRVALWLQALVMNEGDAIR